ncbi:MAG: outer membrane beta-barrel protein [Pseudomonadota bacterium]
MPEAMPAPVAAHDWSGAYVGLGYGRVSGDVTDPLTTFDYESGNARGAFVGFNMQRGTFVYGGELGYSSVSGATILLGGGDDALDSLLDLRGRVGFAVGKALIYGALGYSRADLTINATDGATLSGTSAGLGADFMVTQRILVGVDYTSRKLDGRNELNTFDIESTVNTVGLRVGLSF